MMWYKEIYFKRRDWILENFSKLNINCQEFLILMLIDAANESNIEITNDYLKGKSNLSMTQINKVIESLATKKYLKIKSVRKRIDFNIDGIFIEELATSDNSHEILKLVEDSFGRLLSQQELQSLISLTKKVEYETLIYAVRQAVINNKLSMNYLEKVALNEATSNT